MLKPVAARRRQAGMSIVELMVGVAIGLLIVAASSLVVSSQLFENRRLVVETQMQQDLRAAADIVTRDLRRAGTWGVGARAGVWYSGTANVNCNLFAVVSPASAPDTTVIYRYLRGSGLDGPVGFRLNGGVIEYSLQQSAGTPTGGTACAPVLTPGNWQALTDSRIVNVTTFTITPTPGPAVQLSCPKLCADGTAACWPTLQVRQFTVDIAGVSTTDNSVSRSISTTVRLRNDLVQYNDSANPTRSCPT